MVAGILTQRFFMVTISTLDTDTVFAGEWPGRSETGHLALASGVCTENADPAKILFLGGAMSKVVNFPVPTRIPVSKSKRFDIFARDGFTCQYCGRRPPDVILEPDHIVAVANGGTSEDLNLITSCFDCNRGKRDKILGEVHPRPDADLHWLKIAQERVEIDRYLDAKRDRDESFDLLVEALNETWQRCLTDKFVPNAKQWTSWLETFSPDEIESAIKKAVRKYQSERNWQTNQQYHVTSAIRYVSGILNTVRKRNADCEDQG